MPLTKDERKVLDSVQIMFTKQEDDYLAARTRKLYKADKEGRSCRDEGQEGEEAEAGKSQADQR